MAKEIIIPKGTYKVGIDFPEGTYIFDSMGANGMFDLYQMSTKDEENIYFNFNEDQGYQCRITLHNKDYFILDTQTKVTKAEVIAFED